MLPSELAGVPAGQSEESQLHKMGKEVDRDVMRLKCNSDTFFFPVITHEKDGGTHKGHDLYRGC